MCPRLCTLAAILIHARQIKASTGRSLLLPEMSGLKSGKMMDDDGKWRHYLRFPLLSRSYTPRMIHIVDGLLAHVVSILHAANDSYSRWSALAFLFVGRERGWEERREP